MAKPHLFADVPEDGLTLETQLYTQRLEDVAVPQDYKFRLGDLTDMLVSEGLLGLWESDGANALMQVSDNDNILIGNGSGSSLTGTRNILLGFETGALIDSDFSVGIGSRSLRESVAFQPTAIGANAGEFSAGLSPLFIGDRAGRYSTSDYPVAIGWRAGYNGSGGGNIAIGTRALEGTNSTSGENNIAIGSSSQFAVVGGSNNIGIGSVTLINNVFGSANTAIGRGALRYVTTSDNVAIGYRAGQGSGGGGVFLGAEAGKDETGSNKLYIANSSTTTPLIHGVFPNDFIRVNGKFEVSDKTGIATTFAGWQGDQIVDSGVSTDLSSYDQDLTLSGSTIGITGGSSFNLSSINYWSENASDDLFFLGNVGVNTGNPSEALHVVGTMRMQGFFRDSNNSLGTNGQFLGRDNFGVVWQTPSLQNLTWNSTSNTIGITGGSSFNLSSINYWSENASDDLFFLGNVGVNTGNPSEALHVVGTMRMQGFFRDSNNSLGTNGQFLGRDNFGVVWQTPSLQNLTWNSTSNIIGITGGSSFNLSSINYWSENASDDLFFLGNVGVNTGNPSEALHVVGTMRMQGFFRDSNNSLGTNGQFLGRDNFGVVWQTPSLQNLTWNSTSNIIGITGGSSFNLSSINYWSENASDDLFFLGNVGVNTGNPSEALHVVGTMRMQGFFRDSNNSLGTNGQFLGRDNDGVVWQTPSLQNLTWNSLTNTIGITGGSSFNLSSVNYWSQNGSFELFSLENVGIGNINPAFKLDVTGNLRVSTDLNLGRHLFDSNGSAGLDGYFLGRDSGGTVWQTPYVYGGLEKAGGALDQVITTSFATIDFSGSTGTGITASHVSDTFTATKTGTHRLWGKVEIDTTSATTITLLASVNNSLSLFLHQQAIKEYGATESGTFFFSFRIELSSGQNVRLKIKRSAGSAVVSNASMYIERIK